jgi:two-component system, OmpR family, phosphate regulon sensor histidine kinase PhoR
MAAVWTFALARLAGIVLLGVALGLAFGPVWLWVTIALGAFLAWQLRNLFVVERWLRLRSQLDPPSIGGVWGNLVAEIARLHRRKQYHKQRLAQLFRELRRSTAALPDGVIVLSRHHEIVWFNRRAAALLGLQRRLDVGLRVDNLIRAPEFIAYLHSGAYAVPVVIRPASRADTHLSLQIVPYGAGQSMLLARDVTRQMHLEATRKDFVANASHELRTPLTVISGYLDTLSEDSGLDPAWNGPIRDMRAQAQRMGAIIADLLELSRLEAVDGEAPREAVDVPRLLERLHRDALVRTERPRDVRIALDSQSGLYGAPREIESAFTNLLDNALKYTPPDGVVRIGWRVDAEGAHFSVVDSGIGIPAEHIPRLTERFYRVDPGRARSQGGSGLGLAIVKHALQRHGGRLEVHSVEGRGSTFACHFPPQRVCHPPVHAVAGA